MKNITHKQMEQFSLAIFELHNTVSLETLGQDFNRILGVLFPAEYIAANYFDGIHGIEKIVMNRPFSKEVSVDFFIENQQENPLFGMCESSFAGGAISQSAVGRWSDFTTLWQFRQKGLYYDFYRRMDSNFQMVLTCPGAINLAMAWNRDTTDFTDKECALLRLLAPHLKQAYAQATVRAQIKEAMDLGTLAVNNSASMIFSETGILLFCTEEAERLCARYFPNASRGTVPFRILSWLSANSVPTFRFHETRGDSELLIEYVGTSSYQPWDMPLSLAGSAKPLRSVTLLRMSEKPLYPSASSSIPLQRLGLTHGQQMGLTPKEAEVLLWVAEGKSNQEIAIILASKKGTISKHLEHIFPKLGVENRTSAAAVARDALG